MNESATVGSSQNMLPLRFKSYLDRKGYSYSILKYQGLSQLRAAVDQEGRPLKHLVKTLMLADKRGPLLVVYPASHGVEVEKLNRLLNRALRPAPASVYRPLLQGADPNMLPPAGKLLSLPMVVDQAILGWPQVIVESGSGSALLRMSTTHFARLSYGAPAFAFSRAVHDWRLRRQSVAEESVQALLTQVEGEREAQYTLVPDIVRKRLQRLKSLPAMPRLAARLMKVHDLDMSVRQLAAVISEDPAVSAQMLRYARSPFYGYEGKVNTVQEALHHVLGVEQGFNIAFALAVGRRFNGRQGGPLGMVALWRHVIYSASLCEQLMRRHLPADSVDPGIGYLASLLQNVGWLMLWGIARDEMVMFNSLIKGNRELSASQLGHQVLGIDHSELGADLLDAWRLPRAMRVVARHHHEAGYAGRAEVYVHFTQIANYLLKQVGLGDGMEDGIGQELCQRYEINSFDQRRALKSVLKQRVELDTLTQQIAI